MAGVSQSYVVALEGSRSSRDGVGPVPTIDVLVRLASALGQTPTDLLSQATAASGPHVLLIVDSATTLAAHVTTTLVDGVDTWISAGERADTVTSGHHIDLHHAKANAYKPEAVAAAIERGLHGLSPSVAGKRVGVVFSESAQVLLGSTDTIVDFEHDWGHVVSRAAWSAGALVAWNICVYELDVIKRMSDPLRCSLDLITSHDTVWTTNGHTVLRNRDGAMRLLRHLRPTNTAAADWRAFCHEQLQQISYN